MIVTTFTTELDTTEYVIIDRGNGEFTSMTKETYDAQQAADTVPSNSVTPPVA